MTTLNSLLLLLAFLCVLAEALGVVCRIRLGWLGLAFWLLIQLLGVRWR